MDNEILISASIVTYNDCEKAEKACKTIIENTNKYPMCLYIIDNASSDKTVEILSSVSGVNIIENDNNIGFGAAHNKVLQNPMGKYHFVINPDIKVDDDVLSKLVDFLEENEDIVMVMPRINNEDGTEQKLPKEIPTFKRLFLGRLAKLGRPFYNIREEYTWSQRDITEVTDIDFCSGCFFVIRTEVFRKLGGFDERYFMYLEDADLTLRAKKFGRVVINPKISVTHLWERESAKSLKYLVIHIVSSFKFLFSRRNVER